LGALDVAQALRVDEDTDPVARELEIALLDRVGEVELVREHRATGRAHAEPQAEALAPAREETADVVRGGLGESDARSHAFRSCLFEWPSTGPSLRRWSAGRCSASSAAAWRWGTPARRGVPGPPTPPAALPGH